jgi:hypothetical protein
MCTDIGSLQCCLQLFFQGGRMELEYLRHVSKAILSRIMQANDYHSTAFRHFAKGKWRVGCCMLLYVVVCCCMLLFVVVVVSSCIFLYLLVSSCIFLYLLVPSCTFLYLLVPSCTFLYLLVPSCTFLYLLVPSCIVSKSGTPTMTHFACPLFPV